MLITAWELRLNRDEIHQFRRQVNIKVHFLCSDRHVNRHEYRNRRTQIYDERKIHLPLFRTTTWQENNWQPPGFMPAEDTKYKRDRDVVVKIDDKKWCSVKRAFGSRWNATELWMKNNTRTTVNKRHWIEILCIEKPLAGNVSAPYTNPDNQCCKQICIPIARLLCNQNYIAERVLPVSYYTSPTRCIPFYILTDMMKEHSLTTQGQVIMPWSSALVKTGLSGHLHHNNI